MSKVAEFIKRNLDPINPRQQTIFLLRETTESERTINHGRLPNRFWLILFPAAGAAKPFAIIEEFDDGRELHEAGGEEVDEQMLELWVNMRRRVGDW